MGKTVHAKVNIFRGGQIWSMGRGWPFTPRCNTSKFKEWISFLEPVWWSPRSNIPIFLCFSSVGFPAHAKVHIFRDGQIWAVKSRWSFTPRCNTSKFKEWISFIEPVWWSPSWKVAIFDVFYPHVRTPSTGICKQNFTKLNRNTHDTRWRSASSIQQTTHAEDPFQILALPEYSSLHINVIELLGWQRSVPMWC